MGYTRIEQQLARNQVLFRRINQKVQQGFDEIRKIAKEDKQEALVEEPTGPLYFLCECSDTKCRARVPITLQEYIQIHKCSKRFCVVPNHEIASIEKVVEKNTDYEVVEKYYEPE